MNLSDLNAKDVDAKSMTCKSCGVPILRNFAVLFANYEKEYKNQVDPLATYYHRNCLRIMKRAQRAKIPDTSPVPKWDALNSWFAGEEVAAMEKATQEEAEAAPPTPPSDEARTEDSDRCKENAAVFALADKDWQDAGWTR